MLDHVVSADRPLLSAAWRRSQAEGMATVLVELVSGGAATFHFFDVVDCYGATIVVAVEESGAGLAHANQVSYPVLPRYCRVSRDEGGRIVDVDDAAPLLLGWPREDLIGGFPLVLFNPDDHSRLIDTWMETLSDGSNGHRCRARVLRGDGTWAWFEITNYNRLDDPDMARVESEMLDVSEEMAAHEAVRAREQLLQRLAETLPLGVVQLDRDQRVVYRNDYLSRLLGHPHAASFGEQFVAVLAEDRPVLDAAIDAAIDEGCDGDVTARVALNGQPERVVRVITRSLETESGEVSGVIVSVADVSEETRTSRDLERRATFDALTGCHNRASILSRLEISLHHDGLDGTAVVFVDLDGFKEVNDRRGHAVGDELLQQVAEDLRAATRGTDNVGRIGGDEFLIVCQNVSLDGAMQVAHRISDQIARHPTIETSDAPLRASVGVAWAARGTTDGDSLVASADEAMYESKRRALGQPHLWIAQST